MREMAEYTLNLVNSWISNIDSKTSYGLSVSGVLSGFILVQGIPKAFLMWKDEGTAPFVAFLGSSMVVLLYIFSLIAICFFIFTLKARVKKPVPRASHLFFGDIANMEHGTFSTSFKNLCTSNYEDELIDQIYINSCICSKKVKLYNFGLVSLIIASILCFVCMIFQLI